MLPVNKIEKTFVETLRREKTLVFTAPPGSGKSTLLPRFIADMPEVSGQVVVLQPRRLAARSLASSVAFMSGLTLGKEIGYQVRGESCQSASTRISFRTVGLLLRQMSSDPQLKGIGAIVLDEFHERSWQADLVLALASELQKNRPDLYLLVMSATIKASSVCDYLKCSHLEVEDFTYPVLTHYQHFPRQTPIWERAAKTVDEHLKKTPNGGDVLVFMPGSYEIFKTSGLLNDFKGIEVHQLYGSLPPEKQDHALRKSARRKVIVTTNIAETSLTVEGVDTVVDAGYARVSHFDVSRGLDSLDLEPISVFSADQRSGRAGRLGPGTAYRLWSKEEHSRKPMETLPEIHRVDTSEVLLSVYSMGYTPESFNWYEKPGKEALVEGVDLLNKLGAVKDNKLTPKGALMAEFPAHPRLASMLITAAKLGCYNEACSWATIVSERSPVNRDVRLNDEQSPASDLRAVSHLWKLVSSSDDKMAAARKYDVHLGSLRTLNQVFRQLNQQLEVPFEDPHPESICLALLSAFPDRLARRVDRGTLRYRFANGKTGELARNSAVRDAEFIIPLDVTELNSSGSSRLLLTMAVEISFEDLEEYFGKDFIQETTAVWNETGRIVERVESLKIGDFVLREKTLSDPPDSLKAAEILVEKVLSKELKINGWNSEVDTWVQRVRWLSELIPEQGLITYDEQDVKLILLEMFSGCRSYKEIKNLPVLDYFKNALSWQEQQFVRDMTPDKIKLANDRSMKLTYEAGGVVRGSGFIQDFYGMTTTPEIAGGRARLIIEMLAPSRRPVHITEDLAGFWSGVYIDIRSQLAGRYPKHKWI